MEDPHASAKKDLASFNRKMAQNASELPPRVMTQEKIELLKDKKDITYTYEPKDQEDDDGVF